MRHRLGWPSKKKSWLAKSCRRIPSAGNEAMGQVVGLVGRMRFSEAELRIVLNYIGILNTSSWSKQELVARRNQQLYNMLQPASNKLFLLDLKQATAAFKNRGGRCNFPRSGRLTS